MQGATLREVTDGTQSPPPMKQRLSSNNESVPVAVVPSFGASAILASKLRTPNSGATSAQTPKTGHSASVPIVVSPATQPDWSLPKDPDPMMQALIENMLAIEKSLLEIQHRAKLFLDSVAFMCRTMADQASHMSTLCNDEPSLATATSNYAQALRVTAAPDTPYSVLVEYLDLKVFGPISVNVEVIREIKKRVHERAASRKRSSWFPGVGESADPSLDARVFDELSALERHRFDVIGGIYEGLRSAQKRFFSNMVDAVSLPTQDPPPKAPPPGSLKPTSVTPYPPAIVPSFINNGANSTKKGEPVTPAPKQGGFNPDADKVKSDAPGFSRFNDRINDEFGDDGTEDFEEYDRRTRGSTEVSSPTRQTRVNGNSNEANAKDRPALNLSDEDEFDTV